MEIDDASELVIREALRRLGPDARLDPTVSVTTRRIGIGCILIFSDADEQNKKLAANNI